MKRNNLSFMLWGGYIVASLIVLAVVLVGWTVLQYFYLITAEPLLLIIFLSLRVAAVMFLLWGVNRKRWLLKLAAAFSLFLLSVLFVHFNQGMQEAMMRTVCDDVNMTYDVGTKACVKRVVAD